MTDLDRRDPLTPDRRARSLLPRVGGRRAGDPPEPIDALLAHAATDPQARERLIDVEVVARRLNVTSHAVRRWIRADKLRVVTTPTGRYRVPLGELARLLKARQIKADATDAT